MQGLYDASTYRLWLITAHYSFDKYIFAGSEEGAKAEAEKLIFKDIGRATPRIREIKL